MTSDDTTSSVGCDMPVSDNTQGIGWLTVCLPIAIEVLIVADDSILAEWIGKVDRPCGAWSIGLSEHVYMLMYNINRAIGCPLTLLCISTRGRFQRYLKLRGREWSG